jgi:hypothetical protein
MQILRSRKAVSNIIGGVFLIVIIILAFNGILWFYTQQSNLMSQSRSLQQLQQQTKLEQIQVVKALVTSQGKPNSTIQNIGPIAVHIVDMFITARTGTITHRQYSINYYIDPGSTVTGIGLNTVSNLDPQQTYAFTFITERGNGVGGLYTPTPQSTGSFATFGNLGYLSVSFTQNGFMYTSQSQSTPTPAWAVSKSSVCWGGNVIFWVTFTNHGVANANILHWSMAQLWEFQSGGGGGTATDFYIVGTGSTPWDLIHYVDNAIIVPASTTGDYQTGGTPTTLLFGADRPYSYPSPVDLHCSLNDVLDFFIVVSYTYNGQQYNQLTPYAAMAVTTN